MFKKFLLTALIAAVPAQAWAACTQADLVGKWRFNFDLGHGITPAQAQNLFINRLSCILTIENNGTIVPGACQTVDATGDKGAFIISPSNRKLRLNPNTCGVLFSGPVQFLNDFGLQIGNSTWSVDTAILSISADKQTLLGSVGSAEGMHTTVTAIKLATP